MKNARRAHRERQTSRQQNQCYYCGCKMMKYGPAKRTIDHFVPKALGGTSACYNLVMACLTCNRDKADLPPTQFKSHPMFNADYELRIDHWISK